MRCPKCKKKMVCARCAGRLGGQAKVPKGFAVNGRGREAVRKYWDSVRSTSNPAQSTARRNPAPLKEAPLTGRPSTDKENHEPGQV